MELQFEKMILCLDQKSSAADLLIKKKTKKKSSRKCNGEERIGKDRTIYIFFKRERKVMSRCVDV